MRGEDWLAIMARQRGLLTVGYHFVIDRDSQVKECRPFDTMGSHCPGLNHNSIGVCLMGGLDDDGKPKDTILQGQMDALEALVGRIRAVYGWVPVIGHGEVCRLYDRACPVVPDFQHLNEKDHHGHP